jgi:hypothetical protein
MPVILCVWLMLFILDDENVFVVLAHVIMLAGVVFFGEFKVFGLFARFFDFLLVKNTVILQTVQGAAQFKLREKVVPIDEHQKKQKNDGSQVVPVLERSGQFALKQMPRILRNGHAVVVLCE